MMLKRLAYLVYYYKKLDNATLKKFIAYVTDKHNVSKISIWKNIIGVSLKYNISILDYFYFKFYELTSSEKETYAGTGYMYEYQLLMNPKGKRELLENKLLFLEKYSKFINHSYSSKKEFLLNAQLANKLLNNTSGKIVLKSSDGQCGEGIKVINIEKINKDEFLLELHKTDNDLIEEFIVQHDDLMKLSPSGLNTIRIFTQLDKNDKVEILGARLRITINSSIDNLAAGNIAASINEKTGILEGAGVYSDITKQDEITHPITGIEIIGFQVPFWKESLQMVKEAALLHKENRSIGWDVAITNNGPELLEGNHNWCKLLWQLPVKKGLKAKLEKYL